MAELTSLGTTSPRYNMHTAMYFPLRGSQFTYQRHQDNVWHLLQFVIINCMEQNPSG